MIAYIDGKITHKEVDHLVIEIGDIGYEVFLAMNDLDKVTINTKICLYIYEYIREDVHQLYGFTSIEAKQFFIKLLQVNGVGPKVAISILSAATLDKLQQAIHSGNADLFKVVSGVGHKTAQRIIVDLRGKLDQSSKGMEKDSAYLALMRLGYSSTIAAKAVADVAPDVTDEKERIRQALKEVAK